MTDAAPDHSKAQRHLARVSPVFKRAIKLVGPCTLRPDPDHFGVLARFIIYQQISTKAAASISGRLTARLAGTGVTPAALLALADDELRACGISAAKARFLRALADHAVRGAVSFDGIDDLDDAELGRRLTAVPGIGPWTVHMYLMFGLGRPDVLPVGDLGLRFGVRDLFGLPEAPTPAELLALAEPWRPYRSAATWYVWRTRGFVPQSGIERAG